MEKLIKNILISNDFSLNEAIGCFQKKDRSYFFIKSIESDHLEKIKNKSNLNESDWYRDFLTHFNEVCGDLNYPALEKNSSLIILVNSNDITAIESFQSQILLLEEDQFYVKKYVIVYTATALDKIIELTTNEQLQIEVNNKQKFKYIFENGFNIEQEDYILLLQLFIKLPFLTLEFNEHEFITLTEKLNVTLGTDYSLLNQLDPDQIGDLDFLSVESESEIEDLLTLLANDSN